MAVSVSSDGQATPGPVPHTQIDADLRDGRLREVLERTTPFAEDLRGDLGVQRAHVAALSGLGRHGAVIAHLLAEGIAPPTDPALNAMLAKACLRAGRFEAADTAYLAAMAGTAPDLETVLGYVDVALAQNAVGRAATRADHALTYFPNAPQLLVRKARVLHRLGRNDDALGLLRPLVESEPPDIEALLSAARIAQSCDAPHEAEAHLRKALSLAPRHGQATRALADLLAQSGRMAEALALCDTTGWPGPVPIGVEICRTSLLRKAGHHGAALAAADAMLARYPQNGAARLEAGWCALNAGKPDVARAHFEAEHEKAPQAPQPRLGLARSLEALGAVDGAIALLLRRDATGAVVWETPMLALDGLSLCWRTGRAEQMRQALDTLDQRHLARFGQPGLVRLIRLAGLAGAQEMMIDAINRGARGQPVTVEMAMLLLRMALDLNVPDLADDLHAALIGRVPAARRSRFAIRSALMRLGPARALAAVRAEGLGALNSAEAGADLVRLISQAGHPRLAFRLGRRLARRFGQGAQALETAVLDAALAAGDTDAAAAHVAALAQDGTGADGDLYGLHMALDTGALSQAQALVARRKREGLRLPDVGTQLRLALALGDLPGVEALIPVFLTAPGRTLKGAHHFRSSHLGGLVEELRLHRAVAGAVSDAEWTAINVHGAQDAIDAWHATTPEPDPVDGPESDIPRRIVQFWHAPEPEPATAEVMDSWRGIEGWHYRRFDRRQAERYLEAHFGPEHVRAFKMANHVTEQSDFFRLCALWHEGGLYVDADDRAVGDPEALRGLGQGLILLREPYRSLGNNVILARPGHPALRVAIDLAMEALLRRDNDSPWAKTGPGLLTRAVATYLQGDAASDGEGALTIVPQHRFRPFVRMHTQLPYKGRDGYWNREGVDTPRDLKRVLAGVVRDLRRPSAGQ